MISAHILLGGIVQGVGFRWFVRREADRLGLTGTVKNLADGSVEIHVEGEREVIDDFVELLKVGNGFSRVDSCRLNLSDDLRGYKEFKILLTGY
ncbi:MAG TPA: acylphosphatase [Bacteroidetes bacterium]|nr:acylphosphatase [Bacteroidota bacterium]